jgi:amino-acid N-acetyltransferase
LNLLQVEERDGVIVACAAAHWFAEEGFMELACLTVSEEYRISGRGEILLKSIEQHAKQLGAHSLFVLTTQTSHWFRERGFVETDLASLPLQKQQLYNHQRASKVLVKTL